MGWKRLLLIVAVTSFLFFFTKESLTASAEGFSKGECVIDVGSRRILFEMNGDKALPMASTTKILTAITVLEHCENIDEKRRIPMEAVGIEGSSIYLKVGDEYTIRELLYGLMLRSGNDSAVALALLTASSLQQFSVLLNETAQKAGSLHSHFITPHGLPCKNHYTSARDLAYITAYALENPVFAEIVSTTYYAPKQWKNKNKMLHLYEGAIGVKTGYTKEAGKCLVSSAKRGNMTLVCVVLSCSNTYGRSCELLDGCFKDYTSSKIVDQTTPIELKSENRRILSHTAKDVYFPLLEEERGYIRKETQHFEDYTRKKTGEIVGQMKIYLANRLLFSVFLYKL